MLQLRKALSPAFCRSLKNTATGFTLVELIVAITIALLITAGVVQVFSFSKHAYQTDEGLARLQESGRFAIEFLTREIRMAGNMGCLRTSSRAIPPIIPIVNNLNSSAPFNIAVAVQGFEANSTAPGDTVTPTNSNPADTTSGWTPTLDSALVPGAGASPNSDVLVVRRLNGSPIPMLSHNTTTVSIPTDRDNDVTDGQIALLADCEKASLFQVTSKNNTGTAIELAHGNSSSGTPGNGCDVWGATTCPPGDQNYGPTAALFTFDTYAFFVAADPNNGNVPTLFQARLVSSGGSGTAPITSMTRQPLVEGVENMQVLYGVDNVPANTASVGDGVVDAYKTAASVTTAGEWPFVVSVRIGLMIRTRTMEGRVDRQQVGGIYSLSGTTVNLNSLTDGMQRRVFDTVITLRNRAS